MTDTSTHREPITPGPAPEQLPWIPLLVLGGATLVMVTGEMLPTAVLPQMSSGLGVSESRTALLVSLWAAVVVAASFPLARLARRWDPPRVVTGSLLAFAGSAAVVALAPTYAVALGGRLLGAAAVGLLWATVNAFVADLVPDRLLGRATAVVLGGATLGMVLGTPVGRAVADLAGWRASFWVLAAASLLIAWLVRTVVPVGGVAAASDASTEDGVPGSRTWAPMALVTALVALVLVGHYGAYTFVTRLVETPAAAVPGGMGMVLLTFGLASAVGVVVAGRTGERQPEALALSTFATGAAVLALTLADGRAVLGVLVVVGWGMASGALPPLAQTTILRLAGREHRRTAGALIPVLFNGGIAVGAALASWVVAGAGVAALPIPAAGVVVLAGVGLLAFARR